MAQSYSGLRLRQRVPLWLLQSAACIKHLVRATEGCSRPLVPVSQCGGWERGREGWNGAELRVVGRAGWGWEGGGICISTAIKTRCPASIHLPTSTQIDLDRPRSEQVVEDVHLQLLPGLHCFSSSTSHFLDWKKRGE